MSEDWDHPRPAGMKPWQGFVSASCEGEVCSMCCSLAVAKVGEEIAWDDPFPARHNLTAYVCHDHFCAIFHRAPDGGPVTCSRCGGLGYEEVCPEGDTCPNPATEEAGRAVLLPTPAKKVV